MLLRERLLAKILEGDLPTKAIAIGSMALAFFFASQLHAKVLEPHSPEIQVGHLVPDFALKDIRGQEFKLSNFRGGFVFLNFWATWCPPCVEEFPLMEAFHRWMKSKNFSMIAVSVDKSIGDLHKFYESISRVPSFLVLLDSSSQVADRFGTKKFPETYLIDPRGYLVRKIIGAVNWMDPKVLSDLDQLFEKTE